MLVYLVRLTARSTGMRTLYQIVTVADCTLLDALMF